MDWILCYEVVWAWGWAIDQWKLCYMEMETTTCDTCNLPSICHWIYFHTSKGHIAWIIKKVNRIPTHCGVAYESVRSLARGHMIRVWHVINSHSIHMWDILNITGLWEISCKSYGEKDSKLY